MKFIFAGGVAAAVNIIARYCLDLVMGYQVAIIIAHLIGMVVAYVLTKLFVFEATGARDSAQFGKFALVNIVSVFIVWAVSVSLARGLFPRIGMAFYPDDVAHILGVGSTAISSYLLHKNFTFRG